MLNLSLFVSIFSPFFFHSNEHAQKIKSLMLHNFRVLFIRDFTFLIIQIECCCVKYLRQ